MNLPNDRDPAVGFSLSPEKRFENGYGVIKHSPTTIARVRDMIHFLTESNAIPHGNHPYDILAAGDIISNAVMWLVVHSTYAQNVYLDGRQLQKEDFKKNPEGHTGGSLNISPAYTGYLMLNALMGKTRAWVMEQGHTVAAIDSLNLLVNNMKPAHENRYSLTDEGLSRYVQDFYSFKVNTEGKQDSPRGSHVNHNTAGGLMEGGYLGFASVQYVHMPLPHERLVVFLSDGAFEEQRGSDWAPRFWRPEDSGLVAPIMILNGRRIDQRSTMSQTGGAEWLSKHLKLNSFDPIIFDGRDPAAFAWAIFEIERRLKRYIKALDSPNEYPVSLPYGIAVAPKGAGFYGEGTNAAHNLPLVNNPYEDELTRERFNYHAHRLWVPETVIKNAVRLFNNHEDTKRLKEKEHPIANRDVKIENEPKTEFIEVATNRDNLVALSKNSSMVAIDRGFVSIVKANPQLRPRVGNPDEIRSNKMEETLELLKFRAEKPEGGNLEAIDGKIITALNEEAIAGAAFGNKGGINIIVTYEAFGAKIFGEARQETIFAQHLKESEQAPKWLSVPIVLSSHAWENGKNEQSHQDPSMAENMYGEMSDIARVLFPLDYNTAAVVIREVYNTHGQIWTLVVSKRDTPDFFTGEEAERLYADGGLRVTWAEHRPDEATIALLGVGTYQLIEMVRASKRLKDANIPHTVSAILEPGRFRNSRSPFEERFCTDNTVKNHILPEKIEYVGISTHTRPEIIVGSLHHWFGKRIISEFGFFNHGGTLSSDGLLYINHSSWAHVLRDISQQMHFDEGKVLTQDERDALDRKRSPDGVIVGKAW